MDKASDKRRFWSDGHGIYHIATFGERFYAGLVDWAVALFIGGFVGATVTVAYVYLTAKSRYDINWYVYGRAETGGILLFEPVTFAFATIVHLVFAIRLARGDNTLGYRALRLRIERDNLDRLGLMRCLLHKFIGSPGLALPYLLFLSLGMVSLFSLNFEAVYDQRIGPMGILRHLVTNSWPLGVYIYWIAAPIIVVINHLWVLVDAKSRAPHDIMLDTVVVQDRILSTNRAAFPSTGRAPVARWD